MMGITFVLLVAFCVSGSNLTTLILLCFHVTGTSCPAAETMHMLWSVL